MLKEIKDFLQIENLTAVRVLNRYDAENITEDLFNACVNTVFSEPQVDNVSYEVPTGDTVFAVEPLPGQYDQKFRSRIRLKKIHVGALHEAFIAFCSKVCTNANSVIVKPSFFHIPCKGVFVI